MTPDFDVVTDAPPPPPPPLTRAETALREERARLSEFMARRVEHERHLHQLAEQRAGLAYRALAGDLGARRVLDKLHQKSAVADSEFLAIDAAIAEAQRKVMSAEADQLRAKEAAAALEVLDRLAEFRSLAASIDLAAQTLVASYQQFNELYRSLLALGVRYPESEVVRVSCRNAVISALMPSDLALHRNPPLFVAPNQRHTFNDLAARWSVNIESWARQCLDTNLPEDDHS